MKERATGKTSVLTMDDVEVPKGAALPPEANGDLPPVTTGPGNGSIVKHY